MSQPTPAVAGDATPLFPSHTHREAGVSCGSAQQGMFIRPYHPSDLAALAALFYRTVHEVNARDYPPEQLDVWAPAHGSKAHWAKTLLENTSLVAIIEGVVVGFGDIDASGYLDHLYVHADYQGRGVATALCDRLEAAVEGDITTHASITARGFFEKRGYRVIREQQVELQGLLLTNFEMRKTHGAFPPQ